MSNGRGKLVGRQAAGHGAAHSFPPCGQSSARPLRNFRRRPNRKPVRILVPYSWRFCGTALSAFGTCCRAISGHGRWADGAGHVMGGINGSSTAIPRLLVSRGQNSAQQRQSARLRGKLRRPTPDGRPCGGSFLLLRGEGACRRRRGPDKVLPAGSGWRRRCLASAAIPTVTVVDGRAPAVHLRCSYFVRPPTTSTSVGTKTFLVDKTGTLTGRPGKRIFTTGAGSERVALHPAAKLPQCCRSCVHASTPIPCQRPQLPMLSSLCARPRASPTGRLFVVLAHFSPTRMTVCLLVWTVCPVGQLVTRTKGANTS